MRHPVPPRLARCLDDPYDRVLAGSILGTADAAAIHDALRAFCRGHLAADLGDVTFCELSVGGGFGLLLADGRRTFLKAWPAATSAPTLDAVHTVQATLAEQGFPAPAVLVRPEPFMAGRAAAMQWLDRGAQRDANRPALRRAMAATLARLVALASPHAGVPGLPRQSYPDDGAVWPAPHNALFDFDATRGGAEWIDAIGAASVAVARRGAGRVVVGHRDWSVKNLRFERGVVSAVYDWDSLAVAREPEIVGLAAATFTATFSIPVARVLPTPESMVAFIADYEAAARRAFTAAEWETAGAAATYVLAYTARCAHAANPGAAVGADSAAGILRAHAHADADSGNILARLARERSGKQRR